jgi:hypothetical protein
VSSSLSPLFFCLSSSNSLFSCSFISCKVTNEHVWICCIHACTNSGFVPRCL